MENDTKTSDNVQKDTMQMQNNTKITVQKNSMQNDTSDE